MVYLFKLLRNNFPFIIFLLVLRIEICNSNSLPDSLYSNSKLNATTALLLRQPYLQTVTETSIIIRWRTNTATNSIVNFGENQIYNLQKTDPNLVTEHEVLLSNLTANTKYYYQVGSSSEILQGDAQNYFRTAKKVNSTFRVWVTGDFGYGNANQQIVKNAYKNFVGNSPADIWLWLGDNAYSNGSDTEYTNNAFGQYPDIMKNTPFYPAIGNHDYGQVGYQSTAAMATNFPYFSIFSMPKKAEAGGLSSNTEKYYSYNYGDAHFVVLDSYGSKNDSQSPMYLWLKNDLIQNQRKWVICYFHHPPYTKGTHDSDTEVELINMRTNILPLLESYNVDLVLGGHSHVYERSHMLNGHYGMSETFNNSMIKSNFCEENTENYYKNTSQKATIYAVCGVSGFSGVPTVAANWPHKAMKVNDKVEIGSMILDINKDTLSAKFINGNSVIKDAFLIIKPDVCTVTSISESKNSGDWNLASTWQCGNIPTITSCVIINKDHIVNLPIGKSGSAYKLYLNGLFQNFGNFTFGNGQINSKSGFQTTKSNF